MTEQHQITPPPERFKQWEDDILNDRENVDVVLDCAWKDGFRAGADMELDACCEYVSQVGKWFATPEYRVSELRKARRPKPPSLAEEALALVEQHEDGCWRPSSRDWVVIRRAVERLQELENNG